MGRRLKRVSHEKRVGSEDRTCDYATFRLLKETAPCVFPDIFFHMPDSCGPTTALLKLYVPHSDWPPKAIRNKKQKKV